MTRAVMFAATITSELVFIRAIGFDTYCYMMGRRLWK